ncbi:hypothetical protein HBI81_082340 [Parastagonospora nodorum]|nr:hypothetical protein HBI81_082340 [Parastagonospora nodorum]
MILTSDEYETLYAEVEREMRERAILCQSLRTTTAKEHIRQIARVVASRQNSPLQSTAPDSRLRTITHLATGLRNNDGYAKAVVYITEYKDISSLDYTQFIRILERETRIRISTEARWHGALQDTVATKLYRAIFVIELLI